MVAETQSNCSYTELLAQVPDHWRSLFVSSSCTDTHTVCDSFLPLQQSEEVGRCRLMLNFANRPAQVVPDGPNSLWVTGCESAAPTGPTSKVKPLSSHTDECFGRGSIRSPP